MSRTDPNSSEHMDVGGVKVLAVDDSGLVRRALAALLGDAGYTVKAASSGEEAFELCLTESFDAVVSDVTMGALSGVQLCRLLRNDETMAAVPIILLTAADDPRSRFWGRNAGADRYIAKEQMLTDLLPRLREVLRERPRQRVERRRPTSRTNPLERLSQVLDHHLFQAVVASEVRRLMDHLNDRSVFSRSVLKLAAEVTDYAYLLLRLAGPEGPSYALHARSPWPARPSPQALSAIGLEPLDGVIDVVGDNDEGPQVATSPIEAGDTAAFPIEAGGEQLGELRLYGGNKRLAGADKMTVELLAREVGVVAKSLFLMEQTRRLAMTDGLTGLHNRRRCNERLEHELERAERHANPLTIALCDVDHFKSVNDRFGHNIGDDVLRAVAGVLAGSVRRVDMVSRWGGEEFLIILPNATSAGARIAAERIRRAVETAPPVEGGPEKVTISIGVATYEIGMTIEALVEHADKALYRAKERGRNRVEHHATGS